MYLENRFFYRLVKASHYFIHFIAIVIMVIAIFLSIPSAYIPDTSRSYIICKNSKESEPVGGFGGYIYSHGDLAFNDDIRANLFCSRDGDEKITDPNMLVAIRDKNYSYINAHKNYSLKIFYEPRNWRGYIVGLCYVFLFYAIFYLFSNIINETVIYVAYGRKFTWNWLKNIILVFKNMADGLS